MNPDLPAAVVIGQHLSPTHASLLVDLLGRASRLPVTEIVDGAPIKAGQIYVAPPNHDVEVEAEALRLHPPTPGPGPKPRVGRLFQSLAASHGGSAVAVVLSGTGSDGAVGMMAVRAGGGLTIVQEPESAQYDGMPRAAIDLGAADLKLDPSAIGAFLNGLEEGMSPVLPEPSDAFDLLASVTSRHGHLDLHRYRRSSVLRRVGRRMAVLRIRDLAEYASYCDQSPDELIELVQDLFINVTAFFRDPDAYDALRATIAERFDRTVGRPELRVWVAGCASGEEAYSLAIMLDSLRAEGRLGADFRIFATDVNEQAIAVARRASYPVDAVASLPPEVVDRYFVQNADTVEVRPGIRDRVVFSTNDLGVDAPFSRMDLVTCRNVLIYFEQEFQRQALHALHFALNPRGSCSSDQPRQSRPPPSCSWRSTRPRTSTARSACLACRWQERRQVRSSRPVPPAG